MNKLFIITFFMSINCILSQSVELEKSVFDFTVKDIYGEDFNFS